MWENGMELTGEARSEMFVVHVDADRIAAAGAISFKGKFCETTGDIGGRIVLDVSRVNCLDSSGLGAVVAAMKLLGPKNRLELTGLTPTVEKVFRLTRMDSVFRIHESVEAAEAADPNNALKRPGVS